MPDDSSRQPPSGLLRNVRRRLSAAPSAVQAPERLLWTLDGGLAAGLTQRLPTAQVLKVGQSGWCVIGNGAELTDEAAAEFARGARYGLVDVDPALPQRERYMAALGDAVHLVDGGEEAGGPDAPEAALRKVVDYFFALGDRHHVEFQPVVDLRTMEANEWECLFRPQMPMLPRTITEIVSASLIAKRTIDLDMFVVDQTLRRIAEVARGPRAPDMRFSINLLPASLVDDRFEAVAFADRIRAAGLQPRQIVVECTEHQPIADLGRMKQQVEGLRRRNIGFQVDNVGAGYASFTVVAALEPSVIKMDREIIHRIGNRDAEAKRVLVESFVSFGTQIGATVVAKGIENGRDLDAVRDLGVDFGQGFLLGRPARTPQPPRV